MMIVPFTLVYLSLFSFKRISPFQVVDVFIERVVLSSRFDQLGSFYQTESPSLATHGTVGTACRSPFYTVEY